MLGLYLTQKTVVVWRCAQHYNKHTQVSDHNPQETGVTIGEEVVFHNNRSRKYMLCGNTTFSPNTKGLV